MIFTKVVRTFAGMVTTVFSFGDSAFHFTLNDQIVQAFAAPSMTDRAD
ncbi:hypothetical protein [Brevibacillus reuszeri]